MATIHPTALVDEGAELGADVRVGPYCVIGGEVRIGAGTVLHSHVVVAGDTRIGAGCQIYPFASLGHAPQDLKYAGEKSRLVIGERNVIREHVTMNPGTTGGGLVSEVGSGCLFMVGAHVAHDCHVGNQVIMANNATLAGHCTIGDFSILGGLSAVHQFVRIGRFAFVGGMSGVENDIIPFGSVIGNRAELGGLNIVGLKRQGIEREAIHNLRKAYRLLFSNEGTLGERLEDVDRMFPDDRYVQEIISFVRAGGDRALCVPRQARAG